MHTRIHVYEDRESKKYLVLFYEAACVFSNFHLGEFLADARKDKREYDKCQKLEAETEKPVIFNTSEQYFMYRKALLVGDEQIAEEILKETNPMKIKLLGRKLAMSEEQLKKWSSMSRDVMYRACLEKFSQNEVHRLQLFRTHGMQLVEASPTDKIWGIGLGKNDKRAENPEEWRGSNWLGQVLDRVREELWENPKFRSDREIVEREEIELRCQLLEHFK